MAENLRGCGLAVEVQPANKVKSVAGYRAVILGAPLYMFHWHADAKRFLSKRHSELGNLPVAIFALGPFHHKEDELKSAREMLDKELAKFTWLKPTGVGVFVGKFDPLTCASPTT